jgi:hypothetical protein
VTIKASAVRLKYTAAVGKHVISRADVKAV